MSSYLCHTKPLFEKYNTMNIFNLYERELGIFMYKYRHGLLPKSFDLLFVNLESIHNYNTRNKENYRLDIHKTKSVLTSGPKLWNSLPCDLRTATSVKAFKDNISIYIKNNN